MKILTSTGTHSAENVSRELVLTLKNTSEIDQNVILIESPALKQETSQVVKAVTFGTDKTISFNDTLENQRLSELRAFASVSPIQVSKISLESESNSQISEEVFVKTPVLFADTLVEKIEAKPRKGGSDYEMPALLFIGEGSEISFKLKAGVSVKVTLKLEAYKASRLVQVVI